MMLAALATWKLTGVGLLAVLALLALIKVISFFKNLFHTRRIPLTREESKAYHSVDGSVQAEQQQAEAEEQQAQDRRESSKAEFMKQLGEQETEDLQQVHDVARNGTNQDKQSAADKLLRRINDNKLNLLWAPFVLWQALNLLNPAEARGQPPKVNDRTPQTASATVFQVPPGYTLLKNQTYEGLMRIAVRYQSMQKKCSFLVKDAQKKERLTCRRKVNQCQAQLKGARTKKNILFDASLQRTCPNVVPWQIGTVSGWVAAIALGLGLAFSVRQNLATSRTTLVQEGGS